MTHGVAVWFLYTCCYFVSGLNKMTRKKDNLILLYMAKHFCRNRFSSTSYKFMK